MLLRTQKQQHTALLTNHWRTTEKRKTSKTDSQEKPPARLKTAYHNLTKMSNDQEPWQERELRQRSEEAYSIAHRLRQEYDARQNQVADDARQNQVVDDARQSQVADDARQNQVAEADRQTAEVAHRIRQGLFLRFQVAEADRQTTEAASWIEQRTEEAYSIAHQLRREYEQRRNQEAEADWQTTEAASLIEHRTEEAYSIAHQLRRQYEQRRNQEAEADRLTTEEAHSIAHQLRREYEQRRNQENNSARQATSFFQGPSDDARQRKLQVQSMMRSIVRKRDIDLSRIIIHDHHVDNYYSFRDAVHKSLRSNGVNENSAQMKQNLKYILLLYRAERNELFCCGCDCALCVKESCTALGEKIIGRVWFDGGAYVRELTHGFTIEHMNRIGKEMTSNQATMRRGSYRDPTWDRFPDVLADTFLSQTGFNCNSCMLAKTRHWKENTSLEYMRQRLPSDWNQQFEWIQQFMTDEAVDLYRSRNDDITVLKNSGSIDYSKIWKHPEFQEMLKRVIYCIQMTPEDGVLTDLFFWQRGS